MKLSLLGTLCVQNIIAFDANTFGLKLENKMLIKDDNNVFSPKLNLRESAILRHDLKQGKRASKNIKHTVVFSVQQQNMDKLEAYLNDVSDPKSSNFGKHLTKKEIVAMTANPVASEKIELYLQSIGATVLQKSKFENFIHAEATIDTWEKAFGTKFYEFEQVSNSSVKILRALEYSVSETMAEHVSAVFNTVQFPENLSPKEARALRKEMNLTLSSEVPPIVTPALLNSYYNIYTNTGNNLGSQSVYEALNQTFSPTDLTYFQEYFQLPLEAVSTIIGGHVSNSACTNAPSGLYNCVEANLDVQYMMAVSQVTPMTYYYWTGSDYWLDWVTTMADSENPPLVTSISYGSYENYMSVSYGDAFNTEAIKLGVMGVTLIAASGDDGVANFHARTSAGWCGYFPSFPASSPYVTAVGGTSGPQWGPFMKEIACQSDWDSDITTGGGFSRRFSQPNWQSTEVNAYLSAVSNTNFAPQAGFSTAGRGYPDVSIAAVNYLVSANNEFYAVSGTSASAPVFGGMIALINAKRLAAGKSALGWINPSLYALYTDFIKNDITSGFNNCAAGGEICCTQGFYAMPGWDPVTGLGSVDYAKLETAFFALGPSAPSKSPVTSPTKAKASTSGATTSPGMVALLFFSSLFGGILVGAGLALLYYTVLFRSRRNKKEEHKTVEYVMTPLHGESFTKNISGNNA